VSSAGAPGKHAERPRTGFLFDLGFLLLASAALIIPSWLASPPERRPRVLGAVEAPRRIHLNRAAWYEWTLLPGIGEARARRIVDFRASRGGFRSVEDLDLVPGLPRGFAERTRPYLTIDDPVGR
jgi:competence protein ComEA